MKIIKISAIWCSACLVMKKVWREVESEYQDIEYINYDYDMDEEEIEKYNVGSILPVYIFMEKDKEITRLNGEKTKEEIVSTIDRMRGK